MRANEQDRLSFSSRLREELLTVLEREETAELRRQALCLIMQVASRPSGRQLKFKTRYAALADYLATDLEQSWQVQSERQRGQELEGLILLQSPELQDFKRAMQDLQEGGLENFLGQAGNGQKARQQLLAALFLAAGSMASPEGSYQLDFSILRKRTAEFCQGLLHTAGIRSGRLLHQGYVVLYIKEGDQIAAFLQAAGAYRALLRFEELRVEKDMNNLINRQVNCDSANAERQAGSSARQWEAIHLLARHLGLEQLPEDLRQAAQARLDNPGASLQELGSLMRPPLGKSGMNHRLRRLEEQAERLRKDLAQTEQGAGTGDLC